MFNGKRTKRGTRGRAQWRTPQQLAADRAADLATALRWRAEARGEVPANGSAAPVAAIAEAAERTDVEKEQRALFAAAMARAEFGRFYWNDERKRSKRGRRDQKPAADARK